MNAYPQEQQYEEQYQDSPDAIPVEQQIAQNRGEQQEQDLQSQYETTPSQNEDFARWQLDANDILQWLQENFGGKYWDKAKGQYVQRRQPLMNQKGIDAFFVLLRGHLSHIFTLTNLDEKDIKRMTMKVTLAVIHLIFQKHKEFEIQKAYYDIITTLIEHMTYASLLRAKNGMTLDYLKTAKKSVEQFVQRNDISNGNKGIFGTLFRR